MSIFDPNHLSADFEAATRGYLKTPGRQLHVMLELLPRPMTLRERAIYAAICWGVEHPAEWDAVLAPVTLRRRPGVDFPAWVDR